MPENSEHHHNKLSFSQLVNVSLAVFLFLGVAVTSYTVYNLRNTDAEAARGGKTSSPPSVKIDQPAPSFGDSITFTSSGGNYINVVCYQSLAAIVYNSTQAVGSSFLLTGTNVYGTPYNPAWGANCYAYLKSRLRSSNSDALATTAFFVGPQP